MTHSIKHKNCINTIFCSWEVLLYKPSFALLLRLRLTFYDGEQKRSFSSPFPTVLSSIGYKRVNDNYSVESHFWLVNCLPAASQKKIMTITHRWSYNEDQLRLVKRWRNNLTKQCDCGRLFKSDSLNIYWAKMI